MVDAEVTVEIEPVTDTEGADAAQAHATTAALHEEHATESADDAEGSAGIAVEGAISAGDSAEVAISAAVGAHLAAAETQASNTDVLEALRALPTEIANKLKEAAREIAPEESPEPAPLEVDSPPEETHWYTKRRFVRKGRE